MGKIAEQLESVFFDFYKELRCIYEEEHAICLTNEAWNEYLNDYMNNDVCSYIAAIIIAKGIYTNNEQEDDENIDNITDSESGIETETENLKGSESYSEFITHSDIKFSINQDTGEIIEGKKGIYNLSPVCTGFFRGTKQFPNIERLVACFNARPVDHRVFNEIHYIIPGDPDLTMGFGHHANGGLDNFFKKMPEMVMDELCEYLKSFIISNTDNSNKDGITYIDQFWNDPTVESIVKENNYAKNEQYIGVILKKFFKEQSIADWANFFVERKNTSDIHDYPPIIKFTEGWHKSIHHEFTAVKIHGVLKYMSFVDYNNAIVSKNLKKIDVKKLKEIHEGNLICVLKMKDVDSLLIDRLRSEFDEMSRRITTNCIPPNFDENGLVDPEIFCLWRDQYNEKIREYIRNIEGYIKYNNIIKELRRKKGGKKIKKLDISLIRPKYIQLNLFPGGDVMNIGYWFFDSMKMGLTLKNVCWWQTAYFVDDFVETKYETDAANATMSSWKSTGSVNTKLEVYSTSTKRVLINNAINATDKAVLYWNNYNMLKKQIRYRNAMIWKYWYENDLHPSISCEKGVAKFCASKKTYDGKDVIFTYSPETKTKDSTKDFKLIDNIIDESKINRNKLKNEKIEFIDYVNNNFRESKYRRFKKD